MQIITQTGPGGPKLSQFETPSPKKPSIFKKVIVFIVLLVLTGSILTVYKKYRARQERTKKAEETKNAKAPEISLTIIEGWTSSDIGDYLEKKGVAKKRDFLETVKKFNSSSYDLLATKPRSADLEGFLFPDTYRIFSPTGSPSAAASDPSTELVKKMLANITGKFTPEMQAQAKKNGLDVYKTIILASIIEKETGRNVTTQTGKDKLLEERKVIAGIFYNRLNSGMALESDATVNYVTGKNDPGASLQDIKIDSPYNTYKYPGLPPGPICSPSLSSITAALYPTATEYFYFLHKQPSGEVVYSKTFEEHVANKNRYLK